MMNEATRRRVVIALNVVCIVVCFGTIVNLSVNPDVPSALANLDCCEYPLYLVTLGNETKVVKCRNSLDLHTDPKPPTFGSVKPFYAFQIFYIFFTFITACTPKTTDGDDNSWYMVMKCVILTFGPCTYIVYVIVQFREVASPQPLTCTELPLAVVIKNAPWVFFLLIIPFILCAIPIVTFIFFAVGYFMMNVYMEHQAVYSTSHSVVDTTCELAPSQLSPVPPSPVPPPPVPPSPVPPPPVPLPFGSPLVPPPPYTEK